MVELSANLLQGSRFESDVTLTENDWGFSPDPAKRPYEFGRIFRLRIANILSCGVG